jgi:hypothetical protein
MSTAHSFAEYAPALIEGETSGTATPFDFEAFIESKRGSSSNNEPLV